MKYTEFKIKKYKGINNLSLELFKLPNGKVFPLVGLNESGKTTILEAIYFFQKDLEGPQRHGIIHKKDSGSFTGDIEVVATLDLDDTDNLLISNFLTSKSLHLEKKIDKLILTKRYSYKNATYEKTSSLWSSTPEIRTKTPPARRYSKLYDSNKPIWDELVVEIKKSIPKILYFPNFLFDFPDKIYLENIETLAVSEKDKEIQKEYRQIVDDILHCQNSTYKITDFLTKLKATADPAQQTAAGQIKNEIATILNRKILTPWHDIFPGPSKNILIETNNDNIGYYLQIKVSEGTSPFLINERSLGFRWFFGFILFTEFRKGRDGEQGEYVFLFDEPANNLHERSQQKLLTLFENLTIKAKIIYSTHSPYLINRKSILNAFVVKDEGRTKENDWDFRQDIKAIPYRKFVADYPDQETHFKPILDVLEFVDNPFASSGNTVFFEGKFDYYTFHLIEKKFFASEVYSLNFYPGGGVGTYENIFREYLANNRKFIAIFDADKAGKDAKRDYIVNISQELEKNLHILKDVDESFDRFKTESLFTEEERLAIQQKAFPASLTYKKSEFNTAIQSLFISEGDFELSPETKAKFKKVFDFIKLKFDGLQ